MITPKDVFATMRVLCQHSGYRDDRIGLFCFISSEQTPECKFETCPFFDIVEKEEKRNETLL